MVVYLGGFVVTNNDSCVPLGGAFSTINLDSKANQYTGCGKKNSLTVLHFCPSSHGICPWYCTLREFPVLLRNITEINMQKFYNQTFIIFRLQFKNEKSSCSIQ